MKYSRYLFLILILLCLPGCADKEAYNNYLSTHQSTATRYYNAAKDSPLVDITLPSPDASQPYHIVVNQKLEVIHTAQIKNSEWTGVVGAAVGVIGGVAGQAITSYYGYKETGEYMSAMGRGGMTVNTNGGNFVGQDMMKSTDMATTVGGDGIISVDQSKTEMPPEEPAEEEEKTPEPKK